MEESETSGVGRADSYYQHSQIGPHPASPIMQDKRQYQQYGLPSSPVFLMLMKAVADSSTGKKAMAWLSCRGSLQAAQAGDGGGETRRFDPARGTAAVGQRRPAPSVGPPPCRPRSLAAIGPFATRKLGLAVSGAAYRRVVCVCDVCREVGRRDAVEKQASPLEEKRFWRCDGP